MERETQAGPINVGGTELVTVNLKPVIDVGNR